MWEKCLPKYLHVKFLLGITLGFSSVGDVVGAPLFHLCSQKLRVEGGLTEFSVVLFLSALYLC